ncbi:hydroxyisourate hydrolase [Actinomadura atramentaria]|uniref:hydroxyisourate hydrolase n=1 Tax=Actinomadura atramentaria TaxID=1990 RepID=UPI0004767018|nr:hydroxyisourate hydrolase [Actinomadura atramentaria]
MTVSTHVLDSRSGRPAAGLPVRLDRYENDTWEAVAEGATGADGRWSASPGDAGGATPPGTYRLRFGSGAYFAERGEPTFYPEIAVLFAAPDDGEHHHVPLSLGAFGYSTYRGG